MQNMVARHNRREVSSPAVQPNAAEQPQYAVGFVFPVRPELSSANRDFRLG